MVQLLSKRDWTIFVEGHASRGETSGNGMDAFSLSASRAAAVTRALVRKGISPSKATTVFYGDTRPAEEFKDEKNRRVEFLIRKTDLHEAGHKVEAK